VLFTSCETVYKVAKKVNAPEAAYQGVHGYLKITGSGGTEVCWRHMSYAFIICIIEINSTK